MKRIIKSIACFSLIAAFIFGNSLISYGAISTNAENAVLVDQISGNVMYSKNAYQKAYPASTTKLMTAIIYYEKFANELNGSVTVTKEMMNQVPAGSSTMHLEADEIVTREQLLHGLMLVSGNDAAIVMAYDHSGSMEAFVNEMNNKAKQFGMDSTHFANPHGFHDENHYTTAADFAILTREYLKHDVLRTIGATSKYLMEATNKKEKYTMFNSNRLISSKEEYKDFVYEKATGLKTGFTNKAKNCFVGTATDGQTGLIWVAFGYESSDDRFTESKKVFEYAFNNFTNVNVYKHIKNAPLFVDATSFNLPQYEYGHVDSTVQINAKETVGIDKSIVGNLENGYIHAKFRPLLHVQYPIKDGDYIGHIEYFLDDQLIYTAKAYASKYVEDRSVPALIDTALLIKSERYGSKSFFEQAVLIGREMNNKNVNNNPTDNNPNQDNTTNNVSTETTNKTATSTSTNNTTGKTSAKSTATTKKNTDGTSKTSSKSNSSTTKKKPSTSSSKKNTNN